MDENEIKIQINIAGINAEIKAKSEEDVKIYYDVIDELNIECNNIIRDFGNIDKSILLFYILLKNETNNFKKNISSELFFINFFKEIGKYIEEKNNNKIAFEEKINKIRQNLVVINVIVKFKNAKYGNNSSVETKDETYQLIDKFTNDILNFINIAKNEVSLM